ncbi:MAG: XdhC family protein [Lachnospiraceae bacterium]|nr:XdhC family protein [Lachnospiraceae bacterium]
MTDPLMNARLEADQKNRPYAVLHVISIKGVSPATVGKAMLVDADGNTAGTIGGGTVERKAVSDALAALKAGDPPYTKHYIEGGEKGECCPHDIEVFCEILRREMVVVIIGNGHVGSRLAELCRFLDVYTILYDRHEAFAENPFANECHACQDYRVDLREADLPDGAYYFLGTDSHDSDKEALAGILEKKPAYIGMLGSRRKVFGVYETLTGEGFDPDLFRPLHSPAGLRIASKKPEEVAFSVMAEMLMYKNEGNGASMRTVVPPPEDKV